MKKILFLLAIITIASVFIIPLAAQADSAVPWSGMTAIYNTGTQTLSTSGTFQWISTYCNNTEKRIGFAVFVNNATPSNPGSGSLDGINTHSMNYVSTTSCLNSGSWSKTYSNVSSTPSKVCVVIYDVLTGNIGDTGSHSDVPAGNLRNTDNSYEKIGNAYSSYACVTPTITSPSPSVDIKADNSNGPITIAYDSSATLSWTSSNTTSCTASNAWSGSKSTSGSQSTGTLTSSKTYSITCIGNGGSANDSVTVNVQSAPSPPSTDIKANGSNGPITIAYNSAATISWTSSNATSCSVSPSGWTGTSGNQSSGALTGTKTYTAYCTGPGGSASDSVTVNISSQPPTADIAANPSTIMKGQSSTLTWSSTNATMCSAGGGSGTDGWFSTKPTSGSQQVSPMFTATYTVTCTNSAGQSATDSATITVNEPQSLPTVDISANPSQVASGNPTVLTWTSANADTCSASNGWSGSRNTFGSQVVSLFNTTTYTITCSNNAGQATDSVTVQVNQQAQVTADIKANGSDNSITISNGSSATISWSSNNAASCSISPAGWSGLSGSQSTGSLTNSKTYTITCSGVSGGTATDSVTVQVQVNLPTVDISASPSLIQKGNSSVLYWNSSNADSCFATAGWSGTKSLSGSQSVSPENSITYTITCSNNSGQVSDSTTVSVQTVTPSVDLTAAPTTINNGESTVLVWSSSNADTCTASGGWSGTKSKSGSEVVSPSSDTTYSILCTRDGKIASDAISIDVNSSQPPTIGTFNVACAVSSPTVVIGNTVNFVAGQAGGISPVTFQWSGSVTGYGSTQTASFSTTGTKFATVTATDGQGRNNSASCSVQVVQPAVVTTTTTQPPVVITTASTNQPSSCCCCGGVPTQVQFDENGNPIQIASAKDKSLLASILTADSGGPSTLLYLLLFFLIILVIIAMMTRYHVLHFDRAMKNGNGNGYGNGNGNGQMYNRYPQDSYPREHQNYQAYGPKREIPPTKHYDNPPQYDDDFFQPKRNNGGVHAENRRQSYEG